MKIAASEKWAFWAGTCVAGAIFGAVLHHLFLIFYNLGLLGLYIYLYQKAKDVTPEE